MVLYNNNQSAICLTHNSLQSQHTQHIDIWYMFINQAIDDRHIDLQYLETESMIADIFTKALTHLKFEKFTHRLGI